LRTIERSLEMGNRILKESVHTSDTIARLKNWATEVLFYRLLVACDDYGRFDGRLEIIRGRCYPLATDRVSLSDIGGWLDELESVGLISRYSVAGRPYIAMCKWDNHQRIRNKRSKFPDPPESNLLEDADNCAQVPAIDARTGTGTGTGTGMGTSGKSVDPVMKAREDVLINQFATAFEKATGSPYMRSFGEDRKWAKTMISLLQDSAESEVAARLDRAVERYRTDPQYSPFPTSAIAFQGRVWNRYAAPSKPSQPTRRAMTPAEVEASLRD
jgi:hypothetical protein